MQVIQMKNYYNAGNRIRTLREERRYTREILAEKANISAKFLYEIEIGSKGFSANTLCKLADALGVNTDYILFGEYKVKIDNETNEFLESLTENDKENLLKILQLICKMAKPH